MALVKVLFEGFLAVVLFERVIRTILNNIKEFSHLNFPEQHILRSVGQNVDAL